MPHILENIEDQVMLPGMAHPESKEAIAIRLEITRLALGFPTQVAFTKAMGSRITPQRWNNYESGRDRLTLNVGLDVCRKFPSVRLDWLYRGDKTVLTSVFRTEIDEAERMVKRLSR